ncbi:hypothetical protein BC829DRAFT_413677 [Chytridium lagenaria]|nr:hypothetical protein BC829DRAFT_413677 [Chytridium lagenaria]
MFNPNHETPTHRRQFTNEVPANLNQGAPVVSFYANAQLLTPANSIGSPALYSAPPAGDLQSLQSITPTSLPFMYTSAGSYMSSVPATRRASSEYLFNPPGLSSNETPYLSTTSSEHTYIQGNIPYGGVHFNVNPSMPTSHVRPPSYQPPSFQPASSPIPNSNPRFFPSSNPSQQLPLTLQSMPTARAIVPSSQPYPQMQEVRPILDASAVTGDDEETSGSRQARSVFTKEQRDILEDLMRKKRLTNGTEHRTLRHQLSTEYGRSEAQIKGFIKRYLEKMQRAEEVSQQLPLSVNVETALMPPLVTSQGSASTSGSVAARAKIGVKIIKRRKGYNSSRIQQSSQCSHTKSFAEWKTLSSDGNSHDGYSRLYVKNGRGFRDEKMDEVEAMAYNEHLEMATALDPGDGSLQRFIFLAIAQLRGRSANLKDNLVKKINEAYEKAGHRRRLEQLPKKDIVSGDAFFSHNMTPPVMLSFKRKRWSAVDLDVLEGHPFAFTIPVNAVIPATSEPLEADVGNEDGMEELDQLGEDS